MNIVHTFVQSCISDLFLFLLQTGEASRWRVCYNGAILSNIFLEQCLMLLSFFVFDFLKVVHCD